MSEFMTTLVISGSIFAVMVLTQFGRREYSWHKVIYPVAGVSIFGYSYLHDAPTAGPSLVLYGVGAVIGLVFAWFAAKYTKLEKDASTNKIFTLCGFGFVATWALAVLIRVGFVWSVDNVPAFRGQVGEFMMSNQIVEASIAPFFCLMALVTVIGRTAIVAARVNKLAKSAIVPADVALAI